MIVYALITDLPTLAAMAEETVAMQWRKDNSVRRGVVFTGHNESGSRRWSYDIAATDVGCRVTEGTWDRRHIRLTLEDLKQRAETA